MRGSAGTQIVLTSCDTVITLLLQGPGRVISFSNVLRGPWQHLEGSRYTSELLLTRCLPKLDAQISKSRSLKTTKWHHHDLSSFPCTYYHRRLRSLEDLSLLHFVLRNRVLGIALAYYRYLVGTGHDHHAYEKFFPYSGDVGSKV